MAIYNFDNELMPISKTLLIPLLARARESTMNNPIIVDVKAAEIMSQLDIETKAFDGGEVATLGILARARVIDDEIRRVLAEKPNATIINLGAGLDTRIHRIDNGVLKWYDLDLPEVIYLRREFLSENERIRFIAKSVLDASWIQEIGTVEPEKLVILAEGLLMYFSETEVKQILYLLSSHYTGAHMYFDVVHSYFVGKGISSTFLWGLDKASDIEKMNPNIRLQEAWSTGDLHKKRQSLFFKIMNFLPSTRNRSQILHIQLV